MQISSFSVFWVRFMPPPQAQPPGSNKSQRGRECCKETVTLKFLCEGQGGGMCGDQSAAPRHVSPALQTFPPLHQRPPPQSLGKQRRDLLFSHPPSLPSCASVVCVPRYRRLGWSRQPHLGRQVYYRDERFACSVPKSSPACDELGTPRRGLHHRPPASALAVASPIGTCRKYMWDGGPGSA